MTRLCKRAPRTTVAAALCLLTSVSAPGATASLSEFSLGGVAGNASAPTSARSLDGIAAVVGNGVILKSQLAAQVARARSQGNTDVPPATLRSRVLDRMILRKLQIQRAREMGLQVSDKQVEQGLTRVAKRNGMTLAQFRRAVSQRGMSDAVVKRRIREQVLISKLRRREVMAKVGITDSDVNQYLETQNLQQGHSQQVKFRRLSVAAGDDPDAARDRLRELRREIENGGNFAAVAERESSAAAQTGLVDWQKTSALAPRINAALDRLSAGDVSPIIRQGPRLMLLQLVDRRYAGANSGGLVEQIKAQHILLRPNAIRDGRETAKRARAIRAQLAAGADFGELAREYSDDDATANDAGSLGWLPLASVSPRTRSQLAKLGPGEVSPVLKTSQGFEIIKLNQRRQQDQSEQQRRRQARQALGRERADEQGRLWLRKLRDDAYVDIRIDDYRSQGGP